MIPQEEAAVLIDSTLAGIVHAEIINGLINGVADILTRALKTAAFVPLKTAAFVPLAAAA